MNWFITLTLKDQSNESLCLDSGAVTAVYVNCDDETCLLVRGHDSSPKKLVVADEFAHVVNKLIIATQYKDPRTYTTGEEESFMKYVPTLIDAVLILVIIVFLVLIAII